MNCDNILWTIKSNPFGGIHVPLVSINFPYDFILPSGFYIDIKNRELYLHCLKVLCSQFYTSDPRLH